MDEEREVTSPTEVTIGLGLVHGRTEKGERDHQTIGESEYGPSHPSWRMKLVEQQAESLRGNNLRSY